MRLPGCRTTKFPREVPPLPWYRDAPAQMVMAGFLPFSAIYIELYYIFASIWGHKLYTIYSILFIVFIILVIVTAFITVALTYFQVRFERVPGAATASDDTDSASDTASDDTVQPARLYAACTVAA
jgi:heme/copper-type cytochrome/quinol oxidase subunit 2